MTDFNVTNPEGATDGDDLILGNELPEAIDALEGNDLVLAGGGDDKVSGGEGEDTLLGEEGDDVLIGDRGNDTMAGGAGDDRMIWNNGDGSDVMEGGEGFDTAVANGSDTAGDEFKITAGEDGRVRFERVNFGPFSLDIGTTEVMAVNAGGGDDIITGGEGLADLIKLELNGGAGNDRIIGGDGDDVLDGGDGNDVLVGFRGNDTMLGGAGRDTMVWNNGDGSDIMDGGKGKDKAVVNGSDGGGDVFEIKAGEDGTVDFARTNFGQFTLDISNTEKLVVRGQGGDDVITGGEGLQDLIDLKLFGGAGNDQITGGDGNDLLKGNGGDDVLVGFKGADVMKGGGGRDTMIWNNGDGSDIMNGGNGKDTAVVNGSGIDDVFELSGDGKSFDFARTNFGQFTLDISKTEKIEINGGAGNDTITSTEDLWEKAKLYLDGGEGDDIITGGNTNDRLVGGSGNDVLNGGSGDDTLIGGEGEDVFVFSAGINRVTDFEQSVDSVQIGEDAANFAELQEHLSQVGDDVVLELDSGTMIFENQSLDQFGADDFSFLA